MSVLPLTSAVMSFWLLLILDRHWGRLAAYHVVAVIALPPFLGSFIFTGTEPTLFTNLFCSISSSILITTIFLRISETSEAPKRNHTIPMMMYILWVQKLAWSIEDLAHTVCSNSMPIVGIARLIIASDSRVVIFIFSVPKIHSEVVSYRTY